MSVETVPTASLAGDDRPDKAVGSRWRGIVRRQLTQGASPAKVAATLAVGAALGVFPILGSTTLLCFVAATLFRLNQPVIQAANWMVAWAQIPLVLVFVRFGEWLFGAPPVPFSPAELAPLFKSDPAGFLRQFGVTGLHGIFGWLVAAPAVALAIYGAMAPVIRRLSNRTAGMGGRS